MNRKGTKEKFITKANLRYNSIYDYSKVIYVNSSTKVTIICKEHGEFSRTPHYHVSSDGGCPICKKKYSINFKNMKKLSYDNTIPEPGTFYCVYKTTNLLNNKIYIGIHKTKDLNDGYIGSGLMLQRAIDKYGRQNFKYEILRFCNCEKDMFEMEKTIVNDDFLKREDVYNIAPGGFGGDRFTTNPNKEKIRKQMKNRVKDKNGMYGRKHTKESIEKMRLKLKGRRKGIKTWNAGIHKHQPIYTTYIIISPTKETFKLDGNIHEFCERNNILCTSTLFYINKGIIPPPRSSAKYSIQRFNLAGWEFKAY
jgi:group I intron endonuclease